MYVLWDILYNSIWNPYLIIMESTCFNTLRSKQNGRHFPDNIFICIFLNENIRISVKISLKFIPKGPINTIPALVQKMACRRPGNKPLSVLMMVRLPMHICVTQPHWVKHTHSTTFGRFPTTGPLLWGVLWVFYHQFYRKNDYVITHYIILRCQWCQSLAADTPYLELEVL